MTDITEKFNKQKTNLMAEVGLEKILQEAMGEWFSVTMDSETDTIYIFSPLNSDFYITLSGDNNRPLVEINCPEGPIAHSLEQAAAVIIASVEQKSKMDAIKDVFGGIF